MPFTISHAAVVLPFARPLARWRLLSATIIGSMVPDFGLLLPWRPQRIETHTGLALFTFCLPVGLATFWIFQQLLKTPLLAVVPDSAYARWRRFADPADIQSLKQWLSGACGVFMGAVTHLVWDAFTHEGARGIRMIPVLQDPIVDIAGHHLGGARLLQDVSSLIGLIVVLAIVGYALRPERTGALPLRSLRPRERHLWILSYAATTIVVSALLVAVRMPIYGTNPSMALLVALCAIAALRGFATALIAVSLALSIRLRATPSGWRAAES